MASVLRLASAALAIAASLALVAGCSASAPPATTSPTASTTPEATEPVPGSRVPFDCAAITAVGPLSELAGAELQLTPVPVTDPADAAAQQDGLLSCRWDDQSTSSSASIAVVPDEQLVAGALARTETGSASADWVAAIQAPWSRQCSGAEQYLHCDVDGVMGDYRVEVVVDSSRSDLDDGAVAAGFGPALDDLAAQLEGAVPLPAWQAPTVADDGWAGPDSGTSPECPTLDDAVRDDIFGGVEPAPTVPDYVSLAGVAALQQGFRSCSWIDQTSPGVRTVDVAVAPGSSWIWDEVDRGGATAVDVPGADEAWLTVVRGDNLQVDLLVADSWVRVATVAFADPRTDAVAAAAAIVPHLPLAAS